MFTKLTDTRKAAIFSVLVLCMAVGAALLIGVLEIPPGFAMFAVWMSTPALAALIMLLVVTREGYTREGWKSLGLHRLGLNVWWIAFGVTLLIYVGATAVVWATPLASFVLPEDGVLGPISTFLIFFVVQTLTYSLFEEIGMRGYLQPRLMSLGRTRALLVVGLVWATWHMPLLFLTPALPVGNKLIGVPLFYGTIVAASFYIGYLRIYSGSIWPSSIAHSVINAALGPLTLFTVITASPVLVNFYLLGGNGIVILIGTVLVAIWVGHYLRSGMDEAQSGGAPSDVTPATPAPTATASR